MISMVDHVQRAVAVAQHKNAPHNIQLRLQTMLDKVCNDETFTAHEIAFISNINGEEANPYLN